MREESVYLALGTVGPGGGGGGKEHYLHVANAVGKDLSSPKCLSGNRVWGNGGQEDWRELKDQGIGDQWRKITNLDKWIDEKEDVSWANMIIKPEAEKKQNKKYMKEQRWGGGGHRLLV